MTNKGAPLHHSTGSSRLCFQMSLLTTPRIFFHIAAKGSILPRTARFEITENLIFIETVMVSHVFDVIDENLFFARSGLVPKQIKRRSYLFSRKKYSREVFCSGDPITSAVHARRAENSFPSGPFFTAFILVKFRNPFVPRKSLRRIRSMENGFSPVCLYTKFSGKTLVPFF